MNYDLIRSRVLVQRDFGRELPTVRIDKAKMEQVFINLFMNAIQAMPKGGTLFLRTSQRVFEGQTAIENVLAKFNPGDAVVVIDVEDTGTGIPADKLTRVFDPFFTTKPSGIGTGLGLPVSKQIVDLHGGAIQLCAAARGGTRATITLKAEQEPS